MKRKTKLLLASALLSASIGTTFAGCNMFAGGFALTDFVVNTQNVDLEYVVGETVDFSQLVLTATYNDNSSESVAFDKVKFYLGEEDITNNLSKITETKGTKTIVVEFVSEHGTDKTQFNVVVTEELAPAKTEIESFGAPLFYTTYKNSIAEATNDSTVNGFEGKFFKNEGKEYYVVGNENAFKFLPVAVVFDEESFEEETLEAFVAESTIKVLQGEEYVTLVKADKEGETYVYEYKLGDTLLVTENAAKNEFLFTAEAVDMVFDVSVKPSATVYEVSEAVKAQSIELQVKEAYNVYDATQIAILDNTDNPEWDELKQANGLVTASKNTKGVVFHNDIKIRKEHIPADYQYTLPDDYQIEYKLITEDGEQVGAPEDFGMDRTFLWDRYSDDSDDTPNLFERRLTDGQTFSFYGNYFALDVSEMPTVASFEAGLTPNRVNGTTWYGTDYSNTTLIKFMGVDSTKDAADEKVFFTNLNMKGNAKQDQLLVTSNTTGFKSESLVYCGSLIFAKVRGNTAQFDNIRMQNFFISLFPEIAATANYSRTKCYDSYQDALFVWSSAKVNIQSSYFIGAGGPLIIAQHPYPDKANYANSFANIVISEDSVMKTALTGSEVWFKSNNATEIVMLMKTMNQLFIRDTGKTIFDFTTNPNGEMNIVAVLMSYTQSATDALNAIDAQGSLVYGDPNDLTAPRLDRLKASPLGQGIRQFLALGAPVFNLGAQLFFGYSPDRNDLTKMMIMNTSQQPGAAEMKAAAANADYLGFSQGGISILFGYTPFSMPSGN